MFFINKLILINYTVGQLFAVRGRGFDKLIHIKNCACKDDRSLLKEVLSHELENIVLVLYDVTERNCSFLIEMRTRFLSADSPLIIGIVNNEKKKMHLTKVFENMFEIIKFPTQTKKDKTAKLRGVKKHYISPERKEELIGKYTKEFPEETRHVIASKINRDVKKEGWRPLKITTLQKDISVYRSKKKRK